MTPSILPSSSSAILFVNIGWAESYRGSEDIRGNHGFLRDHADDNAEHSAFLPSRSGIYSCGIGRGALSVPSLDVVFVARHPEFGGHYAVGLYQDASWELDDDAETRPWVRAHTIVAHLIPAGRRPKIKWPGKMDMRRWARRAVGDKGVAHEHLYHSYLEILALLERIRTAVPAPKAPPFRAPQPVPPSVPPGIKTKAATQAQNSPLTQRGDADLLVLRDGATETRQQLHNQMTNALGRICLRRHLAVHQGNDTESQFDALIRSYDGSTRDLLIEVKTSTEPPFCRMAVGQLFDYRRSLPNRDFTKLAVLFPEPPGEHVRAFLADIGVMALWLTPDRLHIHGDLSL